MLSILLVDDSVSGQNSVAFWNLLEGSKIPLSSGAFFEVVFRQSRVHEYHGIFDIFGQK